MSRRLLVVLTVVAALLVALAAPATAKAHHPFGGEQVMVLNIDLVTGEHLYGCDDISFFGTVELRNRTFGMALYSISANYDDQGNNHYEEGWRIFTGKFRVKDGQIKDCDPGRAVAGGTDVGLWTAATQYFVSEGSVDFARGPFRRWFDKTVMQDGYAPSVVTVAGLDDVIGLVGNLWLEP